MLNNGKNIILFINEIFSYLVSSLNFPNIDEVDLDLDYS